MLPILIYGTESTDNTKIRITLTPTQGRPTRSVVQTPVECYYITASKEIVFEFIKDLGTADIRIQSIMSGETAQDSVKTAVGVFSMILFGESGYYTIDISFEDGSHFHGEFQTDTYDDDEIE